jgi:cephalosporin-C deacetylase-like acetyl esterase
MPPPPADSSFGPTVTLERQPEPSLAPDAAAFAYDASLPLHAEVLGATRRPGSRLERIRFDGVDGERVPALLALPRSNDGPVACIVVGHGFGADKHWVEIFDLLTRGGFGVFAIDARFHGERRDGRALEAVATDASVLAEMLRATVVDLRRGIDYLATRLECDPARVGYLGASMGGFIGTLLAGVDERVKAPILMVSGADWRTMLASTIADAFRRNASPDELAAAARLLDPVDPIHWVGRIAPRPVLMIAGDADDVVPPASARALHDAAKEPKAVLWYHGGHALPSRAEAQRVMLTVAGWLATNFAADSGTTGVSPPAR